MKKKKIVETLTIESTDLIWTIKEVAWLINVKISKTFVSEHWKIIEKYKTC